MISTLHIKNIGIIEDLTVNLNNGFNVLTGETGAGKTLIIDSLNLACGSRFSKEVIRRGESFCFVELSLFLPNKENSGDGNIIVSREIFSNGRNICKINGRLVTVNDLKKFMEKNIDIHGQNDNQTIMEKQEHINYLDNFIGEEIKSIKSEYQLLYSRYNEINKELKANYGDEKEKQRKLDLLKYQFNEIEQANLMPNEEIELEAERKKMMNSEKIFSCLSKVDVCLNQNAVDFIDEAIKALEKIEDFDKEYSNKLSSLKSIYYDIQELSHDISNLNDDVYFDDNSRNEIEERLDFIHNLKRKYGNSIEEILEYKNKVEAEILFIDNLEEHNQKLKLELESIIKKMNVMAKKIHEIRINRSVELNNKINKELKELEMKNASFYVSIISNEEKFNINGFDDVEFLITTNVGDEPKSLIKIASGGEISRIMLAIKTVLADIDEVPILIFDEIDTGISGKAAKMVGEKIKIISKNHQVLCITHQANIAAKGDSNYFISKKAENDKTYTNIKKLSEEEIIEEIARISSGDITQSAIEYAREMRYKV